jgi:hypothetical protein
MYRLLFPILRLTSTALSRWGQFTGGFRACDLKRPQDIQHFGWILAQTLWTM